MSEAKEQDQPQEVLRALADAVGATVTREGIIMRPTQKTPRGAKLVVFKGKAGWRWRLRASNGRIVATSGEAFSSRRAAFRTTLAVHRAMYDAMVVQPIVKARARG